MILSVVRLTPRFYWEWLGLFFYRRALLYLNVLYVSDKTAKRSER